MPHFPWVKISQNCQHYNLQMKAEFNITLYLKATNFNLQFYTGIGNIRKVKFCCQQASALIQRHFRKFEDSSENRYENLKWFYSFSVLLSCSQSRWRNDAQRWWHYDAERLTQHSWITDMWCYVSFTLGTLKLVDFVDQNPKVINETVFYR
jgi:hypothetical protein